MNQLLKYIICLAVACFSVVTSSNAQEKNFTIQPSFGLQLWSTYTVGADRWNETLAQYEPVDDRVNFEIHRSRWGIKGTAYDHFSYNLTTSIDFVGRDALSGVVGGANSGNWPRYRLWQAYVRYSSPGHDYFHVTTGFMVPQISRESITAAFRSPSFDKAWSQNYIRRHLVGTAPGRAGGINVGGMTPTEDRQVSISYNFGLFNPLLNAQQTQGNRASVLMTYQLALHLGDPERSSYGTGYKVNYFGQRKGITVALSGAASGANDLWESNTAVGVDVLANYGPLSLSGELMTLQRKSQNLEYTANAGFVRLGVNVDVGERVIEPMINYVFFNGPTDVDNQLDAQRMGALLGKDSYLEFSLHYYLNPNLRFSVAYTARDGESGDLGEEVRNNYFWQGGVGSIRRGDYLGLGLIFVL